MVPVSRCGWYLLCCSVHICLLWPQKQTVIPVIVACVCCTLVRNIVLPEKSVGFSNYWNILNRNIPKKLDGAIVRWDNSVLGLLKGNACCFEVRLLVTQEVEPSCKYHGYNVYMLYMVEWSNGQCANRFDISYRPARWETCQMCLLKKILKLCTS